MRVLVVEDDPVLSRQLAETLTRAGDAVDCAADGEEGHFLSDTEPYNAVVLDLGLPRLDGITVLKRWRAAGRTMPVLILTARASWAEEVQGIDAGAEEYLAKPLQTEALLARLRAPIRRPHGHATTELTCEGVTLDTRSGKVTVQGAPVDLSAHEYRVLRYLMHRKGQVVSRTELIEHIYAQDFDRDSNTIEVFIARLRRKLGVNVIKTIRGLGYRLEEPG